MATGWWNPEVLHEEQIRHRHGSPPGNHHLERSHSWGDAFFLGTMLGDVTPVCLSQGVGSCPRGGRVLVHVGLDGHMVPLVP